MASLPRAKVSSSVAGMASEEQDPSESSLSSYRCGLDIFFGLNNETRDFDRGLLKIRQAASAAVPVPDAVWFANQVFGTELTEEALVELFKRLSNDARYTMHGEFCPVARKTLIFLPDQGPVFSSSVVRHVCGKTEIRDATLRALV